jgi:hypothetical protein
MNEVIDIPKFINKNKEVKVISKVTETKTTKEINHEVIEYKNKHYVIAYTPYKDKHILFVFDADDKEKVCKKSWCYHNTGGYLQRHDSTNNTKTLFLHKLDMNKLTF